MNYFRENPDISRLVFIQNLHSTEQQSITLLRRLASYSNIITTNLFVHESLGLLHIEHVFEPVTNQSWQQLNQALFNTLTGRLSIDSSDDCKNLLDNWSHFLISEINYLYLLARSIVLACQLMPSSVLIVKHALNNEEFDTLRQALFLMNLQPVKHIIDWNDFDG